MTLIHNFPDLEEMAARGDSRLVALLLHERGREWTFDKRWPHKRPDPHCLAFAGFHYTGKSDIVQCIYCGGMVNNWHGCQDPTEVHQKLFPRCPLVNRKPIQNIGSTATFRCCHRHPESLSLHRQRLRMIHNPMQSHSYLVVLLTLLLSIGTMPFGYGATATEISTTTIAPFSAADGQLQAITTWKGLIGIRKRDFIVPEHFSPYTWVLDLTTCSAVETSLRAFADTVKGVPENTSANWPASMKTGTVDLVTAVKTELTNSGLQSIWSLVEATTSTAPIKTGCGLKFEEMLGPELCSEIKKVLDIAISAGVETLNERSSALAAVGTLSRLSDQFLDGAGQLREFLEDLQYGKLPGYMNEFIQSNCQILLQGCPSELRTKADVDYRKLINVVEVKKYAGSDLGKIKVEFLTPCVQENAVVTEFELESLPYEEGYYSVQLIPKVNRVWIQTKQESQLLVEEPELCQEIQKNVFACPPQSLVPTRKFIQGTRNFVHVAGEEINAKEPLVTVDLPNNKVIVGASTELEVQYQCPAQKSQKQTIKGIYTAKLGERCALRSERFGLEIIGSVFETLLSHELVNNPFPSIPQILTFTDGILKKAKIDWVEIALDSVEQHFQGFASYYVGAFGGGIGLLIAAYLIKFLWDNKQYIPGYNPPRLIVERRQ